MIDSCTSGSNYSDGNRNTDDQRLQSEPKRRKYVCYYKSEWETQFTWLKPDDENRSKAICTLCKKSFKVAHGGLNDVKQHDKGAEHKKNIQLHQSSASIGKPSTSSQHSKKVAVAELDKYSVAYVTVPNTEVGKTIGHGLVKNKLAACVNIVPQITSIYEWKGEINEDSEALLMIKTRTSLVDKLTEFVRSNHPYEVCEVISLPIKNGNPPYLKWIGDTVPESKCSGCNA